MRSWLIVVTACLLAAAGLAVFKYQQIQAAIAFGRSFPEPVETVESFVVREEPWQPVTVVTGEALATRTVEISNELAGTIAEVGFAPGAEVDKGQVLVRLDTREEQAQLDAAKAEAELARLEYSRHERLIATGATAQDARDQAKARYDAAQAMVERLATVIDKKVVRAPFRARTGLHQLEPGLYLDKGAVITRLVGIDSALWIDFTLPQDQQQLPIGAQVEVQRSQGSTRQPAQIIARDAYVTESSRNVRFRALLDNSTLGIVPGSLVTVEVPIGEPRTATVVPITAVRRDAFGAKAFVLQPAEEGARAADRAAPRPITLGPQRGEFIIVAEGLRAGERIAASGAFKLREGVLVHAVPMTGAETAGTSVGVQNAAETH